MIFMKIFNRRNAVSADCSTVDEENQWNISVRRSGADEMSVNWSGRRSYSVFVDGICSSPVRTVEEQIFNLATS